MAFLLCIDVKFLIFIFKMLVNIFKNVYFNKTFLCYGSYSFIVVTPVRQFKSHTCYLLSILNNDCVNVAYIASNILIIL